MTETDRTPRPSPSAAQLAWVERIAGSGARVTGGRRLAGGIASSVHRLSLRLPDGSSRRVVLKRYTDADWGDTQAIVGNEAAALAAAEAARVPAPRLLGASPDGVDTDGVPSLLMTLAPGRVWLAPHDLDDWIRQLATVVPSLHRPMGGAWQGQPGAVDVQTPPSSVRRPALWAAARRVIASRPPPSEAVLVHGDYQHFNVLWSRSRLSAIVDWSSSRMAAPDLDVGHCRLNLAVLYSVEVAERFRRAYESEAGRRVDPWWDIHQLLAYDDSWMDFIPVQVAGRAGRRERHDEPGRGPAGDGARAAVTPGSGGGLKVPSRSCLRAHEAARLTSSTIRTSLSGVSASSAKATGHIGPSSSVAACWKPNVEYRALNFALAWKKQMTLPSLA